MFDKTFLVSSVLASLVNAEFLFGITSLIKQDLYQLQMKAQKIWAPH
jgi:hypothetical protein